MPRNFHRSIQVTIKLHQIHHRVEGAANGEKVGSVTPLGKAEVSVMTKAIGRTVGEPAHLPVTRAAKFESILN